MKLALVALITGLLATPSIGQQPPQDVYFHRPACDQLDQFILNITNNICNPHAVDSSQVCNQFIDDIAQTNPAVLSRIQELQRPCLEESLITLKMQYKQIDCKNQNIDKELTEICKILKTNIKNINDLLEKNN